MMQRRELRGFQQLALANWRELVRDPMVMVLILVTPLVMMGMFGLMASINNEKSPVAVWVPPGADAATKQVVKVLEDLPNMRFELVEAAAAPIPKLGGKYEAVVTLPANLENGTIGVKAAEDSTVKVFVIQSVLAQVTRKVGSPYVEVMATGGYYFDPMRFGSVGIMIYALASLAIFGLATPIIMMRQHGILRLLGTTPVSRLTFVLAQVPARLGLALTIAGVALTGMGLKWDISIGKVLAAVGITVLGFFMLASIGYLIGGVMTSGEAAFQLLAPLLPISMMASNVLLPANSLPVKWAQQIPRFIPISYLADALRQLLGGQGDKRLAPLWVDCLVILGTTVMVTLLAVRYFRWDQAEPARASGRGSRTPRAAVDQ